MRTGGALPRLCDFSPPSAVILVQCHCEASAHTGFAIRSRIYPPIFSANGRSNPRGRPPHRTHNKMSVGAGGCPPSCQPIPGHCRVRQSGHFLETGSLLLPLAALRRFPRRPVLPYLLLRSVGADAYIGPSQVFPHSPAGQTGPTPQKYPVGRHPCVPPHTAPP